MFCSSDCVFTGGGGIMAFGYSPGTAAVLVVVAAVAAHSFVPARAEQSRPVPPQRAEAIVVPGGRFASMQDYLAGSWAATRPATHVNFRIRFMRNGQFSFSDQAGGTSVHGRYEGRPNAVHMWIQRACNDHGRNCEDRNPPTEATYPISPLNANEYESADEHWRRLSRE